MRNIYKEKKIGFEHTDKKESRINSNTYRRKTK